MHHASSSILLSFWLPRSFNYTHFNSRQIFIATSSPCPFFPSYFVCFVFHDSVCLLSCWSLWTSINQQSALCQADEEDFVGSLVKFISSCHRHHYQPLNLRIGLVFRSWLQELGHPMLWKVKSFIRWSFHLFRSSFFFHFPIPWFVLAFTVFFLSLSLCLVLLRIVLVVYWSGKVEQNVGASDSVSLLHDTVTHECLEVQKVPSSILLALTSRRTDKDRYLTMWMDGPSIRSRSYHHHPQHAKEESDLMLRGVFVAVVVWWLSSRFVAFLSCLSPCCCCPLLICPCVCCALVCVSVFLSIQICEKAKLCRSDLLLTPSRSSPCWFQLLFYSLSSLFLSHFFTSISICTISLPPNLSFASSLCSLLLFWTVVFWSLSPFSSRHCRLATSLHILDITHRYEMSLFLWSSLCVENMNVEMRKQESSRDEIGEMGQMEEIKSTCREKKMRAMMMQATKRERGKWLTLTKTSERRV